MPFTSLGLSPALLAGVAVSGYSVPTPIQLAAIGPILRGSDVIASAQTGSGKTAAFGLPLLQLYGLDTAPPGTRAVRPLRVLVLVPTRELAMQIADTLMSLVSTASVRPKIVVLIGGVSISPQLMKLRGGADFVVATPGRLLDVVAHNALDLKTVRALVLDEADRLLELGFGEELARIGALLPVYRQTILLSATFAPNIEALAQNLLRDPLRIDVPTEVETAPEISQRAIEVDAPRRTQLLRHLVQIEKWSRVLVFVATKYACEIVADKLRKAGIAAEPFHAALSQGKRTQVLLDFKSKEVQVVVATDVAARGLDIVGLPAVVNYDLPRSATDYTHRIGRTGRAGERGVALSFVTPASEAQFRLIEKRQGLRVEREQIAGFEPVPDFAVVGEIAPDPTGGVKGKRPSKKDKLRAAATALAAADAPH